MSTAAVAVRWRRAPARRLGRAPALALLFGGLLMPTALSGAISTPLVVAQTCAAALAACWIAVTQDALAPGLQVWTAALLLAVVTGASLLSPFREIAPGAVFSYVAMAALFAVDLRHVGVEASLRGGLAALTGALLVVGIGVVTGQAVSRDWLIAWYSEFYPELVENMTAWRKPVFTFGSHSIAGFFYFVLFYLNFETYRAVGARLHLWLAVGVVALGLFLTSVTSTALMLAALGVLALARGGQRRFVWVALVAATGVAVYALREVIADLVVVGSIATGVTSEGAGLQGRYSRTGALAGNLALIREHPFRPIGLTYSRTLFFGDSGPIEYLTRGSFMLLGAVYGALWLFLSRGLRSRGRAAVLFVLIVLFEAGYTVLTYHRFLFLLPFAVLYLNQLDAAAARGAALGGGRAG